jgi:hypothetical protein
MNLMARTLKGVIAERFSDDGRAGKSALAQLRKSDNSDV